MRERARIAAALAIAIAAIAAGLIGLQTPPQRGAGITLRFDGDVLVVDTVASTSRAFGQIQPGTRVIDVNYAAVANIPEKDLQELVLGDFDELGVPDGGGSITQWVFPAEVSVPASFPFLLGLGMLVAITGWLGRGQAGRALQAIAFPLGVASTVPMILAPVWSPSTWPGAVLATTLSAAGSVVLADGFVEGITPASRRRAAAAIAVLAAVASVGYGLATLAFFEIPSGGPGPAFESALPMRYLFGLPGVSSALFAAIALGPAAMLWDQSGGMAPRGTRAWDGVVIGLVAMTPTVISLSYSSAGPGVGPALPLIWLLVAVVVLETRLRFETVRLQRDTVVAATEQERARLAADLHDDALQEMTVLVRRLDEGGDPRAAELARSIADRLREICGDLRLPILDELGAGPALEWLVGRVGETSGHAVHLDRADESRPPAEVELAIFRVAQEALANAVTHGAPPITVQYDAAGDRATLSVTDHGGGIHADAAAASRAGHYGLLNMRQRAEQIGARISVRRLPEGGTIVGLVWAPR